MVHPLNRREFIEATAGVAPASQLAGSLTWGAEQCAAGPGMPADLPSLIDPVLRTGKPPLAAGENAWPLIEAAIKAIVPPTVDDDWYPVEELESPPDAKRDERIEGWLADNRKVVETFQQAVQCGQANLPNVPWAAEQVDLIQEQRNLFRLLGQQSRETAHANAAPGSARGFISRVWCICARMANCRSIWTRRRPRRSLTAYRATR